MPKDYKIFHISGDDQLAHCLTHEEKDGYELLEIIWTGNIQASTTAGIVSPTGSPSKLGLIHLYLIVFVRIQKKETDIYFTNPRVVKS